MNMHLLIVEDDKAFAATLRAEFHEKGWEVGVAHSLEELAGMEVGETTHAVVDLRLGAGSGLEAVALIRDGCPDSRIIVLTGFGSIATAVRAIKCGADDYLTKPVSSQTLLSALLGGEGDSQGQSEDVQSLHEHERDFVEAILLQCGGNISAAARRLGIHRQSLQRKLRKFSG